MSHERTYNVQRPTILHVFDGFRVGGTELRTANIINALGENFRHIIISNNGNFEAKKLIQTGLRVSYIWPKISSKLFPIIQTHIRTIIKRLNVDLMVAYEWGAIDWVLANSLSPCCPMIMTVEGFEDSELFTQKKRRLWIRRLLYRRCNRVVVCSQTLYKIAKKDWKINPPKLLHIPNGVNCSIFNPGQKYVTPTNEVKLGIVASLIKLKNHIKLLKCVANISDLPVSLHIAGDGPEKDKLKHFCIEKGLSQKVHFHGHIDNTSAFLKQIDIFCLSSITEQMPMSVLEAMATGLPIVSTDVGDIKHMVSEENKPFVVDKNDDILYTDALNQLISNRSLRKSIGKANRQKCLIKYEEQVMFEKYRQLYSSCLQV